MQITVPAGTNAEVWLPRRTATGTWSYPSAPQELTAGTYTL